MHLRKLAWALPLMLAATAASADSSGSFQEGAKLAFGGNLLKRDKDGFYLEPALFTETANSMRINREEVFGPVASVISAKDYDEALALAGAKHAWSSSYVRQALAEGDVAAAADGLGRPYAVVIHLFGTIRQ